MAAARSMTSASMAAASPPLVGPFEIQIAGVSSARMSSKSPSLLTLFGANVGDVEIAGPLVPVLDEQPALAAAAGPAFRARPALRPHQHPRSFELEAVQRELQVALLASAASTSSTSGVHVPRSQSMTMPGAVAFGDDAFELAVLDTGDLRRASPGASSSGRATALSARPTRAGRRSARAAGRSGGGSRGASARRRTAPCSSSSATLPSGSGDFLKSRFATVFLERHDAILRERNKIRHRATEARRRFDGRPVGQAVCWLRRTQGHE